MSRRYEYALRVAAGPETPQHKWGLYRLDEALTEPDARARYNRDPLEREEGVIGVVRVDDSDDRPTAYLRVGPRANGVTLSKLNEHGTIEASYTWGTYREASEPAVARARDAERVFLSSIVWYSYPDENQFWPVRKNVGSVTMTFREDGYAREDVKKRNGFGTPDDVTTREYRQVDVTANWFDIPEFGEWETFFEPEPDNG